ncbi:hypothetical protein HB662_03900 [Roseomonas frigidaquae]|uniref:Pectate lyase superfamily protein domain-containing protein n=1 Tax=Falsiroseomonas frigidaquae TaxID=487318 RepID=A0ABX1ETK4_9PROT|nr:hypothetical protein [Falsiroseomonas frigidaquae]NKE43907.1 hypothetical protein [Falsiroseomonas frigidaquae]
MTISTIPANDRREMFTASAAQTVFPFDFPLYAASDIRVVRTRAGATVTLALGVDYAVTGAGEQAGGAVVLASGALAGDVLLLESAMPAGRTSAFSDGGDLPAAGLNADFNRLYIVLQQQARDVGRAISIPAIEPNLDPTLPPLAQRAGKLLGFDAFGKPIVYPVLDRSADTVLADGTTAARSLAQRAGDILNLHDFGGVGDGVADDTAAIDLWFLAWLLTGRPAFLPPGRFIYSGTRLDLDLGGLGAFLSRRGGVMFGCGGQTSIIDVRSCSGTPQFRIKDSTGAAFFWHFRDFGIRCNTTGIGAQLGQDWDGTRYPDFLNSCSFTGLVVQNVSSAGIAALRMNGVLQSQLNIVANNGGCGIGDAIQLFGVQFCTGLLAAGNAARGLRLSGYTFGNDFCCDIEVVNSCIRADDSAVAGAGANRNRLSGVFVWGATNANPAISGNDGTTNCIAASFLAGPLIFSGSAQFGSGIPQVPGVSAGLVVFEHRNQGVTDVGQLRSAQPPGVPALVNLDSEAAQTAELQFRRAGGLRWRLARDTTSEAGSNSGSLLVVEAFSDAGAALGAALSVQRDSSLRVNVSHLWAVSRLQHPGYTVATVPTPNPGGQTAYVNNESGGAVLAFSDGTNWRRVTDRAIVS